LDASSWSRKKIFLEDDGKRVLYERPNEKEGKGNTSIAKKKTTTKRYPSP